MTFIKLTKLKSCSVSSLSKLNSKFVQNFTKGSIRKNSTKPKNKLTAENELIVEKIIKQKSIGEQQLKLDILVYEGQLAPNVSKIKVFSLTTTFLGLVCYPFMFKKASDTKKSVFAHVFVGWTLIMVIFSPLALNYITKRYIIELRFNRESKQFTAKTLNLLNRMVETKFKQSDVYVPMVPGMFTSFLAKGKPMFLDPAYVQDIQAYQHLLGYDKPLQQTRNKATKN